MIQKSSNSALYYDWPNDAKIKQQFLVLWSAEQYKNQATLPYAMVGQMIHTSSNSALYYGWLNDTQIKQQCFILWLAEWYTN